MKTLVYLILLFFSGAPCLSFDVIKDNLGVHREEYPLTCYMVSGTQAQRSHANSVILMKMANLHRNTKESEMQDDTEDDDDDDDGEDEDKKPELEAAMISHTGSINRIRVCIILHTMLLKKIVSLAKLNLPVLWFLALIN